MSDQFADTINQAIDAHCSDLYCLPVPGGYCLQGSCNGKVTYRNQINADLGQRLVSYLKYRGNMAVSEHRRPQAGALNWEAPNGKIINIRVSTVGNFLDQESMVVRFIYTLNDDSYHLLAPAQWTKLTDSLRHRGLFLFAGPMGSGKTTTMYRLARTLPDDTVVMTIEDPVEIAEPRFLQLQVNELAGMGYSDLLRVGLRHRPDVFVIGEIRDRQTAMMAIRAALSGHLVLATIHARNVYGVLSRLRQLNIDEVFLQASISGVGYQRLIPTRAGNAAVLFDFLNGLELQTAFAQIGKVGMTDEWQKQLTRAIKQKQITNETANDYAEG